MINIGIIGCGHWGSNHIRVFSMSGRAKVRICCDSNQDRLKALRKIYPDLITTSDYTKVINDKNIDAIIVATPTAAHYRLVKSALLSGKHVLCEKPLTIKKRESEELTLLARKKLRNLMVGYVFLYNNGIVSLKDYIKNKELGRIQYLHFARTNLGPIRDDVDVIYDLASHDISIASFILGAWPRGVSASAGFFLRKKIADTAFITLYFPDNILVNILVSWLDPKKVRRITCVGDKKMAIWDDLNTSEPIRIFNKGVAKEAFYSDYGEFHLLPKEGEVISPLVKLTEPLKKQNLYFLDCIDKRKKPFTDAVFGHKITEILEAAQLSIKNKGCIQKIG
ncbi:MAG: Gfo/Idh/MocA family oxidoreductase [Candidatus Omnitrophota bacterium]|nr:MAG: Gfo/Idh/MocA family oxidoreductase [Candidatus Omnitrophota bacterium]